MLHLTLVFRTGQKDERSVPRSPSTCHAPTPFSFGTVLARHCFAVKRQCAGAGERGRERLVGRVGVVKVRIHKLSNTYNGLGSPRLCSVFAFKFNIHIQHSQSAFTLTNTLTHMAHLHTHSQRTYSHSLTLSTHSTQHSLHSHSHSLQNSQNSTFEFHFGAHAACGQRSAESSVPVPAPAPSLEPPSLVPRPFFQCVCAAFFARCDQKLKNRLQL